MEALISSERYEARHPHALAIYCSDGRFTRAVEELLARLGHERLDTLTLPGGPALLDVASALPSDRDAVSRGARFLVRGHSLRAVVLLAHQGCGYYRARHPTRPDDELQALQRAQLVSAAAVLKLEHPKLEVTAYYARVVDGRIAFEPVAV
jgi:hypothetical protein